MILQILTWNVVMCVHDPIVPAKDRIIKLVHATRPLFVQKAWTHNHARPIIALPLREIVSTGLLVELEHFLSTCNLILELLSQNCKGKNARFLLIGSRLLCSSQISFSTTCYSLLWDPFFRLSHWFRTPRQ